MMTPKKPVRRVAIIGTGVTGSSRTAQYLARGVLEEAGDRSIEELERERDDVLLGLLALRARSASAVAAK
jgi:predicted NAD/FAD-binding protein